MHYLFEAWPVFDAACRAATHVVVLADYDGTLTPIVQRPEDAGLSGVMRQRLAGLAGNPAYTIGVISGRGLEDLHSLVGLDGIYYAGNHGLEIHGPGIDYINPEAEQAVPVIDELTRVLEEKLSPVRDIYVQNKKFSLSIHYRRVKIEDEPGVERTVRDVARPYIERAQIRLFGGKKVWELRPPMDWDKGKAVNAIRRQIRSKLDGGGMMTVFLGDDTTDEDGFREVQPPDGWSIYVGPEGHESMAGYRLKSPEEVGVFLDRLAGLK